MLLGIGGPRLQWHADAGGSDDGPFPPNLVANHAPAAPDRSGHPKTTKNAARLDQGSPSNSKNAANTSPTGQMVRRPTISPPPNPSTTRIVISVADHVRASEEYERGPEQPSGPAREDSHKQPECHRTQQSPRAALSPIQGNHNSRSYRHEHGDVQDE